MEMVNNGKMFIRRVRGDCLKIINSFSPRSSRSPQSRCLTSTKGLAFRMAVMACAALWVNAPEGGGAFFCDAQLNIIDKALEEIPNFKTAGEFRNA